MTDCIDLNSDLGEGFGVYSLGDDDSMLNLVSSVNIACGFHAGDPCIMSNVAKKAKQRDIAIGAHPSFFDLWGFGRREIKGHTNDEIKQLIIYQVGALQAIANSVGHKVTHIRAHGALGNMSDNDTELAEIISSSIKLVDPELAYMTRSGSIADNVAAKAGQHVIRQVFADRAYEDNGTLVSRSKPGAVIHDPEIAAERVIKMVNDQAIETLSGKKIQQCIDTICVHGDTPASIKMAEIIRTRLENNGIEIRSYAKKHHS